QAQLLLDVAPETGLQLHERVPSYAAVVAAAESLGVAVEPGSGAVFVQTGRPDLEELVLALTPPSGVDGGGYAGGSFNGAGGALVNVEPGTYALHAAGCGSFEGVEVRPGELTTLMTNCSSSSD